MTRHVFCSVIFTYTIMDKITFRISNNLLKIAKQCAISPSTQCIPLRNIASVECFHYAPPRIVILYNSMIPYHRTEIEYSSIEKAIADYQLVVDTLESYHGETKLSTSNKACA
jgi:hypothetical protein